MDIIEQIQSLTEQFSNLFEVEGLGDPASDVPPSTNKIKKDRKTKDGKVELVSVEDELFPYDGNKREQYRQKIIDTINNMIQGTATLEDLLQIVRQKKAPVKEGFEGAIEILEELINEVSNKTVEKATRLARKGFEKPINAEEVKRELQDTLMQHKDNLVAKGIAQGLEMHPEDKANLYNNPKGRDMVKRYKSMFRESSRRRISEKKCFENAIKLLENIIAERKYSDEEIKEIAKKVRPERAKKFSKACDDLDKVTQGKNPDNFTPVQKYRANRAAKKVERTQDRLNHVDDIINPTVKTPTGIKRANEGFEGAIELLEDIHTAIEKGAHEIKRPMLHTKAIMNYSNELQNAAKKELPKDKKKSIKAINNKMNEIAKKRGISPVDNYVDGNKTDESFGSAIEILEEIINEVSLKKWKEAAKNSYDKRKEVADKSAEADKKSWDNYEKQSKLSPEDEPELFKKAVDQGAIAYKDKKRADHAMGVYANTPDSKHSATKYNKAILNSLKGREDKYVETGKKSDLDRAINTFHLAKLNPVKEAQELLELFDRPDLLDDISKTLTNKTIKQHLENQVKKLLGGKKKKKNIKENFDSFEENNYNIVKLLEELINEVSDGKHRRKLEELKDGIKKAEEFKEATKDDVVKEKIDDIIIPQEHRLEVSQNKYEDRVVKRAQEEYDKNKAKKEKGK